MLLVQRKRLMLVYLRHLRHVFFCHRDDSMPERAGRELFLRCSNCGLRSPGIIIIESR